MLNKCQEEFESYAASQEEIIKNMSDLEKEEHQDKRKRRYLGSTLLAPAAILSSHSHSHPYSRALYRPCAAPQTSSSLAS